MLTRLGRRLAGSVAAGQPWTNVYGWARTLLALSTAATLVFNRPATLFRPGSGIPLAPYCRGLRELGPFCILAEHLELVRWLAVGVLLVAASGWRPRLTALPQWWFTSSFFVSAITVDGGDQLAAILTLLLLPVALTDDRRWHWHARPDALPSLAELCRRIVALSALAVVRVQVAVVYFQSAVAKLAVPEWADGTSMYYWWNSPSFGASPWLKPLTDLLVESSLGVVALTWGAIALELVLFMALTMPKWAWGPLLVLGVGFHGAIALIHGLPTFSLVMIAALVLYLRPANRPFARPAVPAASAQAPPAAA
jgi:antimicrobial peptide system SdpB family protein